ncbi:Glutamyl-trna reductase [Neofusicoccum parvum]|uniref:Glutamyl-trna reductase n=1 Tax=Neofusicoccum parvum TaxID=310453 RepID=A0ACB5SMP2_9PEZI|nr:Glutamyl-trna reductase [Neofusicoccum parvum]GME48562.1 Glutamyl-trna reductase [Neofusicoccum parvum]
MNSAYLDSPNGMANSLQRGPPTPGAQHQPNGSGGMPNLVNGLLSGGHQTDMNHLWQVVQQLSDVLQENRNQTANIMNSVQQIQARAAQEGTSPTIAQVNGDLTAATSRQQAAEINNLRAQLQSAHTSISSLDTQNAALRSLLQDYETSLSLVLEKLRPYAHQQHDAIVALHAHYNTLLEKERQANLELRLEHQEWQAGLGRVAQYARHALKESADAGLGYERKIRELKAENRMLRRLANWEEASDSDDDDERRDDELHLH